MRTLGVLVRRELLSYFCSPVASILMFVFLLVNGYTFWILLSALNDPRTTVSGGVMQLFFGGTFFFWLLALLICALLTMRLIAEENKTGTLELLLTAPVRDWEVIVGKFLGAWVFYALLWVPTLVYPAILSFYSHLDWGPIALGYVGVLALGAVFISIGLCTSCLTKNQIIAAVLAFAVTLILFSLSFLEFFIPVSAWKKFFSYVNLISHFDDFGKGVLDLRPLVYYGTLTLFFLYLACKSLESRRWKS